MNLFYSPNIISPITILSEEESKHIVRVLRKTAGDELYFTDGKGTYYQCVITVANPKKCSIQIINKQEEETKRNYYLHIAIAPTKNITRTEWFLEKSTEIGIDEITPIICAHSERKDVKPERLNKVITSAMKQSLKAYHPVLNESCKLKDFIDIKFDGPKYIAYIDKSVNEKLGSLYKKNSNALILIGPEGDFSQDEVEYAKSKGFTPVSLGSSRLRTETAGIVACHTVSLINSFC